MKNFIFILQPTIEYCTIVFKVSGLKKRDFHSWPNSLFERCLARIFRCHTKQGDTKYSENRLVISFALDSAVGVSSSLNLFKKVINGLIFNAIFRSCNFKDSCKTGNLNYRWKYFYFTATLLIKMLSIYKDLLRVLKSFGVQNLHWVYVFCVYSVMYSVGQNAELDSSCYMLISDTR